MRLLRGLSALAILVALVAGSPVGLSYLSSRLLPSHVPTREEITAALTGLDNGTLLVGTLTIIGWVAWLSFIWSLGIEIALRLRGRSSPPRNAMRRLAVGLLASVALTFTSPVYAAVDTAPASVVATAPPHPSKADRGITYRVRQGDTLWDIADRKLGNPRRWTRIWRLNAYHRQVDGRVFSDPDLIHPGWTLRLPGKHARPTPRPTPTPTATSPPPERAAPPTESAETESVVLIALPSGSVVTAAFVAGMSAMYALFRLQRTRHRELAPDQEEVVPEPFVQEVRRAHARALADTKMPPDIELVREAYSIEVPNGITLGARPDGSPVELSLAGLALGLTGPGALAVVRALLIDLLRQADNARLEVILCTAVASELLEAEQLSRAAPGLILAPTTDQATQIFMERFFTHKRLLFERERASIAELREDDPSEELPTVILISHPTDEVFTSVGAALVNGQACGVGVVVLGEWPPGTTCEVDAEHRVTHADGPLDLAGSALIHITPGETAESLRQISATTAPSEPYKASSDTWEEPHLIRLLILGEPIVLARGQSEAVRLTKQQLLILIFLALHRNGVTRDELQTALWPDEDEKDFHTALRHLRDALKDATGWTGLRGEVPFVRYSRSDERHCIDPQMISIDLWDFQESLARHRAARDDSGRIAALEDVPLLCRGPLAGRMSNEWLDEARYPLVREQATALARLADLKQNDPEQAVDILEQLRCLDPDTEETYVQLVRTYLRLGQLAQARRTEQLLRDHFHGTGMDLTRRTDEALAELLELHD